MTLAVGENRVAGGRTKKCPPNVLTSNLVHIIVNLYSFPFVIKEYVCEQLAPMTIMEGRGKHEGTFKDSGKNSKKTSVKEGNRGSTIWRDLYYRCEHCDDAWTVVTCTSLKTVPAPAPALASRRRSGEAEPSPR